MVSREEHIFLAIPFYKYRGSREIAHDHRENMISQKGDVSFALDKMSMSISDSQPASGIATRYRLSARYYLGRCSRKWREHPRDSFLTYRRRKWPTHPPYRRAHLPPFSHEETSFFSSSTPPHFDVPSVYLAWCEVKDSLHKL